MHDIARGIIQKLRAMAGLVTKSVTVDPYTIAYLEGGRGEPVLLAHGFGADKDMWAQFAQYLTKTHHVIVPDLPGFGESSRILSELYDVPRQVQRVHEFTKTIGLNKFHIAGNSMGGLIAGVYAATYPDDLLSLGLMNPAGVVDREPSQVSLKLEKGNNPLIVESAADYDRLMEFLFVNPPAVPKPLKAYYTDLALRGKAFFKKVFMELDLGDQLEAVMGKIHARTLIIWGDADRVFPVSSAAILHQGIKDSQVIIMKDCGHVPVLERAEETAQHYREFIS